MKDQLEAPILLKNCGLFQIYFVPLIEYLPLNEVFDYPQEEIEELEKEIDKGELEYFCAKVYGCFENFEISSDYLGACLYKNFEDFYNNDDYIKDMIIRVENESIEYLKELKETLSVL